MKLPAQIALRYPQFRRDGKSEGVAHALADVRAEILDAHGTGAVHDMETDPRRQVGDVAGIARLEKCLPQSCPQIDIHHEPRNHPL